MDSANVAQQQEHSSLASASSACSSEKENSEQAGEGDRIVKKQQSASSELRSFHASLEEHEHQSKSHPSSSNTSGLASLVDSEIPQAEGVIEEGESNSFVDEEIEVSLQLVENDAEQEDEESVQLVEECVIEVEIEEEDLDTVARDMEPGAVQAVLENNGVQEVCLHASYATISGLTTADLDSSSTALEKLQPPIPARSSLADRIHSDSTDVTTRELAAAAPTHVDFKCQTRDAPSPQESNRSSRESSHQSNGSSENIPVAAAVLVPSEHSQEEQGSTQTPTEGGESSDGPSNGTRTASTEPKSERIFWLTVISVALCLNSFLVGGVVVGGFCLAGRCSSSEKEPLVTTTSGSPTGGRIFGENVPTPSPSRFLAQFPTPFEFPLPEVDMGPADIASSSGIASSSFAVPATLATPSPAPRIEDEPMKDGNLRTPTVDTTIPLADEIRASSDAPMILMLVLVVVAELAICLGLYTYYKKWRRRVVGYTQDKEESAPDASTIV